ncbi:hypothetical protein B0G76_7931 [Paraburkholderia sp. BL23I1N1]|nr:hypothetical protein B0G76_7931 [Paraburkholderia sp. BL23I1N1]
MERTQCEVLGDRQRLSPCQATRSAVDIYFIQANPCGFVDCHRQ